MSDYKLYMLKSKGKIVITMKTIFNFLLLLFILTSCGETASNKQRDETKKVYSKPNVSENKLYDSYIPKNLKLRNTLVIAIDAHANSALAIEKLRWSAENYGFNLIALKNVGNNDINFNPHIFQATQQAIGDLKLTPLKIFYIGFSGGARMALLYAQQQYASGVVMIGAGPGQQEQTFNFPLAMISGTHDFNFIEQYHPINSPQMDNPELITIHWQGKHEWPDSTFIDEAMSFVLYKSQTIPEQDIIRKPQLEKAKQAQNDNNILLYSKELELIFKTSTGKMHDRTKQSIEDIRKSQKANQYFVQLSNILTAEQKRNKIYDYSLNDNPLDWWVSTISKLNNLSKNQKGMEADSYARTKAYLGILLYSKTYAAVAGQGNAKLLPKFFEIYELIEPENPDLFYFKAVYAHALGNTDTTILNLKKAIEYGFDDDEKLHQSFPQVIITAAKNN